ncbi:MAG: hypothetical protein ACXAEU_20810 [Candidatus Hodarchaeales archaeon]|jgi:DNA-directed RNA polymerase subunit RPC12/RpoP
MSREELLRSELVRKLDTTPLLIEGGRLFIKKIVLFVVLFFVCFAILSTVTYFTYQEAPSLFTEIRTRQLGEDIRTETVPHDSKEHALLDLISYNLSGEFPLTTTPYFIQIILIFGVFSLINIVLWGVAKGIAFNSAAKTYEDMTNVPEEERSTVDNVLSRIPLLLGVQAFVIFLTGFLPVVVFSLIGYIPNFIKQVLGFNDENLFIGMSLGGTILLIIAIIGVIYLSVQYLLAVYVAATNKEASIKSSIEIGKKYIQDDKGVIFGLVFLFMIVKAVTYAYPIFELFRTIAFTPRDESMSAIILLAVIFIPILSIVEGLETAIYTVCGVYLHRRYVSYEKMHDKVEIAAKAYDEKKDKTIDADKVWWRQQKVGEMVVADEEATEEEREFISCEYCNEKFFRQVNYDMHLSREHAEEIGADITEIVCEYCGKKITGKSTYQAHLEIFHSAKLKEREKDQ